MEIALLTDVGQKRTNNQDYVNHFVNRAGRTMIILADGMGAVSYTHLTLPTNREV